MMLSKVESLAVNGVDGFLVQIEVDLSFGMPAFEIVGLPDTAVKEARDRVRAAIRNSGIRFYEHRVTVNLAPANIKKEGSGFDLPIAVGILAAKGDLPTAELEQGVFVGELALDGRIRPINGVLSMTITARDAGKEWIVIPAGNAHEASVINGIRTIPVANLGQVRDFLKHIWQPEEIHIIDKAVAEEFEINNLADVKGQEQAKRALEVAAAGGHNILMIGPPGSGKTMLARRLPGILPSLCQDEAIEITKIYSVGGLLPGGSSLISQRPFRSPHHTTSSAGLIGGGRIPRPGEISLAHHGVLFLDELPEFPREVLEVLRQPLEDGQVTIARAAMVLSFPARFMLAAAMNPCPCGYYGDSLKPCNCTPLQIHRYCSRISGPLLDRFDMQIEVPRLQEFEFDSSNPGESSAAVKNRVERARQAQRERLSNTVNYCNAHMRPHEIKEYCPIDSPSRELIRQAIQRYGLSARAYHRILKLARTIADLEEVSEIKQNHLAEAIQYRCLDQKK
jgi:magnesium chelatase family protein